MADEITMQSTTNYKVIGWETRPLKPGNCYQHFKGKIVTIVCVSKDSESLEEYVVYKEGEDFYHRKIADFNDILDFGEYAQHRFKRIIN